MRQVYLVRVREYKGETYGVLEVDGRPRFVTLELSWKNNARNISCIPVGKYICLEHESPNFGWTYLVTNVPGRSDILFHAGNTAADTRGCILVGSSYASDVTAHGISKSKIAFDKFVRLLRNEKQIELIVTELLWSKK